jgi:RNA polymerase sigma-70 factor, ECF subfamily
MNRNPTTADPVAPSTLVARMAAGDDRALGELYDVYGHVAYALAVAIAGSQVDAETVVTQAFAEAWRSASSFDPGRTSVLAWVTSIVRRTAFRVRRGAGSTERRTSASAPRPLWSTAGCPVGQAVRSLTAVQQQVIELSYYRGLTVRQIAAQLGEPESGARELLRSAMQELRTALGAGRDARFDEHAMTRA